MSKFNIRKLPVVLLLAASVTGCISRDPSEEEAGAAVLAQFRALVGSQSQFDEFKLMGCSEHANGRACKVIGELSYEMNFGQQRPQRRTQRVETVYVFAKFDDGWQVVGTP